MFDSLAVTAAASTAKASPARGTIALPAGTITYVALQFPTGCAGLVHARVLRAGHQLWPTGLDDDVASNGFIVDWLDLYPLLDAPYELTLEVWSDDDTYSHTITLFIEIEPIIAVGPPTSSSSLISRLRSALGG